MDFCQEVIHGEVAWKVLGTDHPEVIETMNNLADFLSEKENTLDGFTMYVDAFENALRRIGPNHHTTDMVLANMIASIEDGEVKLNNYPELRTRIITMLSNPKWMHAFKDDISIFEEDPESDNDSSSSSSSSSGSSSLSGSSSSSSSSGSSSGSSSSSGSGSD